MTAGHISLRASGDSAGVKQVQKEDVERISQAIRDRMALSHQATPTAPGPTSAGLGADELAKLAQLRNAGALNEDEFNAQKATLLR
jgi:hypothetical protein